MADTFTYQLECSCGYFAEVGGIRSQHQLIQCPDCGQLYAQRRLNSLVPKGYLISVLDEARARAVKGPVVER